MIIPGQITLELLVEPITYLYISYIVPILFSAIAAFTAHLIRSEKKYRTTKAYVASVLMGILSYMAVYGLVGNGIEKISGIDGLISTAILSGYVGRALLPKLAERFEQKMMKEEDNKTSS